LTKLQVDPGKAQMLDWAVIDPPFGILTDAEGSILPWDTMGEQGYCGADPDTVVYQDGLLQPICDFIWMLSKRLKLNGRAFIYTPYSNDPLDMTAIHIRMCKYLKDTGFEYFAVHLTSGGKKNIGRMTKPNQIFQTVWLVWHSKGSPPYFPDMSTLDFKCGNLMVRSLK